MPQPIIADPIITSIAPKKLVGNSLMMSIAQNTTAQLWQAFMPRLKLIYNTINTDLICMQVYSSFENFTPDTPFQKWAAVEVDGFDTVPDEMETYILPGGLYAVFQYKGAASNFAPSFQYIFYTWLPQSGYEVDNRPHFEVLGAKYKNNRPESEEEIWVPIKLQQ